jgi:hypothetical protein
LEIKQDLQNWKPSDLIWLIWKSRLLCNSHFHEDPCIPVYLHAHGLLQLGDVLILL